VETVSNEKSDLPGFDRSLLEIRIRDHAKRRRSSQLTCDSSFRLKLFRIRVRREAHIQRLLQLGGHLQSQSFRDSIRESLIHLRQQKQHPFPNWRCFDFPQLKAKRTHDVLLFDRDLAVIEERRLTEVIEET